MFQIRSLYLIIYIILCSYYDFCYLGVISEFTIIIILLLLLLLLLCDYITVKENRLIITKYHMHGNFHGTKLSWFSRNA